MPAQNQHIEPDLFQRIAQGDHAAFGQLMDVYWNLIYSQAVVYLKDAFKAKDLVQEVFLDIWKHRQKLVHVESPENYLFIVARNKIFNETRKKLLLPLPDSLPERYNDNHLQPDELLNTRELNAQISKAVNQLPPQRKRIFELSRNEGLTYEAIAEQLGISRETVKVQMVKALATLRRALLNRSVIFFILFFYPE